MLLNNEQYCRYIVLYVVTQHMQLVILYSILFGGEVCCKYYCFEYDVLESVIVCFSVVKFIQFE